MAEERTLKEYAVPSTEEPRAIIVFPTVEGDNFEIKPALLNLVHEGEKKHKKGGVELCSQKLFRSLR